MALRPLPPPPPPPPSRNGAESVIRSVTGRARAVSGVFLPGPDRRRDHLGRSADIGAPARRPLPWPPLTLLPSLSSVPPSLPLSWSADHRCLPLTSLSIARCPFFTSHPYPPLEPSFSLSPSAWLFPTSIEHHNRLVSVFNVPYLALLSVSVLSPSPSCLADPQYPGQWATARRYCRIVSAEIACQTCDQ